MIKKYLLLTGLMLLSYAGLAAQNSYMTKSVQDKIEYGYAVRLNGNMTIDAEKTFLDKSNIEKVNVDDNKNLINIVQKNKNPEMLTFSQIKDQGTKELKPKNEITLIVIGVLAVTPEEFGQYKIEKSVIDKLEINEACDFDPQNKSSTLLIKTKN